MKQILISIKPKWVAKILRGQKTLEIRKTAPKDWVDYLNGKTDKPERMIVNIYCTKSDYIGYLPKKYVGKVVAKFALDDVDAYWHGHNSKHLEWDYNSYMKDGVLDKACLNHLDLEHYVPDLFFYAWHISDLEIFNDPKDLEKFGYLNPSGIVNVSQSSIKGLPNKKHPPQSWCYVEEIK